MPQRFDLIVFDWDGTLMDSAGHIVRAIGAACADLGLPVPAEADARYVIGLGLGEAMARVAPGADAAQQSALVERYRHHYLKQDHEITLFEGTEALIAHLAASAHLLAVATGKNRRGLDRALATTGLSPFFHATRCVDECPSKPHPQMLLELMDELATLPERTLMIGDTSHDLNMANNAGVAALAVTFGAHPVEELARCRPLACLNSTGELFQWLQTNA
jgi:phosphoglycolate phosphatase